MAHRARPPARRRHHRKERCKPRFAALANGLARAHERRRARPARRPQNAMRIALAIVAVFCARFLMGAWFYAGHDGDLAWQQWLGAYILHAHHLPQHLGHETFTAPGSPWVPQEWAFSVAVAWFSAHGRFSVLAVLSVLAAAISLLLV